MRKLTIANKLFLLFCIALILLIIWKVPHEEEQTDTVRTKSEVVVTNPLLGF